MPHVNIKHFPVELTGERETELVRRVSEAVETAFGVDEKVISISLEPVAPELWEEQVYVPEIVCRRDLLRKPPRY